MQMTGIKIHSLILSLVITLIFSCQACNGDRTVRKGGIVPSVISDSTNAFNNSEGYKSVNTLLVLPKDPAPGEAFRILATGGKNILKAQILVSGPSGNVKSNKSKSGKEWPWWRIDDCTGSAAGKYTVTLIADGRELSNLEFEISEGKETLPKGTVWKTTRGWDSGTEALYSAWISALFQDCDEQASWSALHEVTQDKDRNFLYDYLSLAEDDPGGKTSVIMQPDCADNPFFLRAYFAWKLGLPFGFHVCDRGYVGRSPRTGQWITNEISRPNSDPVLAFNAFLRRVMDGVHSGTARTSLDNENSDYYPVALERTALRPGVVFADPYGHTLILIRWVSQTKDHPGLLLSVDAQPDGTVGVKRFWKGNFLFATSEVVGEPGFKAFRPMALQNGKVFLMKNEALTDSAGFAPYSLQQRKMEPEVFYHTMDRLINPEPLDPETALLDLIESLHEQLLVRVTSVANGEAWVRSHPGEIVPMPSGAAGIFLAGGQWENFSTPNRDLRLLIAMDEVLNFPDKVVRSPGDFNFSGQGSPEQVRTKLQSILDQKTSEISITYTRTDGSLQELTVRELLDRRDAFEMAYNPNDCIESRWGAPETSDERATCRRHAPSYQLETMRSVRKWFTKRLHPPT
jgi:hypothetical protein